MIKPLFFTEKKQGRKDKNFYDKNYSKRSFLGKKKRKGGSVETPALDCFHRASLVAGFIPPRKKRKVGARIWHEVRLTTSLL